MKNLKIISVFSLIALFCLMAFTTFPTKKLIVIDAGHGGEDIGAKNGMLTEKAIVEKIAQKVKAFNKNADIEIVLLRPDDNYIKLSDRTDKINEMKPDLVVSLHTNYTTNKNINGIETVVSDKNNFLEKSTFHAENMLENFKGGDFEIRGVKNHDLHMLRNSNCPAILIELGFLSNEKDAKILESEVGQNALARSILKGLE
jgi:N-acetylmuramoyl-L-alanine amidase